jgi:hypothetical protein
MRAQELELGTEKLLVERLDPGSQGERCPEKQDDRETADTHDAAQSSRLIRDPSRYAIARP